MINGRLLIDGFMFFNELDLLKIRLDYLRPIIDHTFVVEAYKDHRGNSRKTILGDPDVWKPLYEQYPFTTYMTELPEGPNNWARVWAHRNAILEAIDCGFWDKSQSGVPKVDIPDNALVLLSDLDEIPHIDALREAAEYFTSGVLHDCSVVRFRHQNFYYNTQTTSPYLWDGAVLTTARQLRLRSPQCVRYQTADITMEGVAGWHFSYFGGVETMQQKMKAIAEGWTGQDAFTDRARIEKVIATGADLYGREGETWIRLPEPPKGLPEGMERFRPSRSYRDELFEVKTDNPVALNSLDHVYPVGATRDNTHCKPFAKKMAKWMQENEQEAYAALDLGCAGGGLVVDYLATNLLAIGIEGSDKPRQEGHGHWPVLDGVHLFTADISRPFTVEFRGRRVCFPVITAFEVLEHIHEGDLPTFAENVKEHLTIGGRFVCTINSHPWPHLTEDGQVVDHHVTQKSPEWWEAFFEGQGLVRDRELEAYIGQDWPRVGHAHFALKRVEESQQEQSEQVKARPVASPLSETPQVDIQVIHYGEYGENNPLCNPNEWQQGYGNENHVCYRWLNVEEDNGGFLGPSNELYHKGESPFVLLLNTDVELKPGWDVPLLAAMLLDPNLGAVGYSGGLLTEEATFAGHGQGRDIDYVEGWCLLLRREAVEAVALSNGLPAGTLFDDRNLDFAYCEDTDLCLRLNEAGWGLMALPNENGRFAVHRGSETTNKVLERNGPDAERLRRSFAANHEYMRRRWASYLKHGRVLAN